MLVFTPHFMAGISSEHRANVIALDLSCSMDGAAVDTAKRAATLLLDRLPTGAWFNVVSFGSGSTTVFPSPRPHNLATKNEARRFIASSTASRGTTNLFGVIRGLKLLQANYSVFLFSDGRITSPKETLRLLRAARGVRLFCLGVGAECNKHLLRSLAAAGRGTSAYFDETRRSKWVEDVKLVVGHSRGPGVSDVRIEWHLNGDHASGPTVAPAAIGSLYSGRRLIVFGMEIPRSCTSASLTATTFDGQQLSTIVSTSEMMISKGDIVHTMAARAIIKDWEEGTLADNGAESDLIRQEREASMVKLSCDRSIVTSKTSFIAVEKRDGTHEPTGDQPTMSTLTDAVEIDVLPSQGWEMGGAHAEELVRAMIDRIEHCKDRSQADDCGALLHSVMESADTPSHVRVAASLVFARYARGTCHDVPRALAALQNVTMESEGRPADEIQSEIDECFETDPSATTDWWLTNKLHTIEDLAKLTVRTLQSAPEQGRDHIPRILDAVRQSLSPIHPVRLQLCYEYARLRLSEDDRTADILADLKGAFDDAICHDAISLSEDSYTGSTLQMQRIRDLLTAANEERDSDSHPPPPPSSSSPSLSRRTFSRFRSASVTEDGDWREECESSEDECEEAVAGECEEEREEDWLAPEMEVALEMEAVTEAHSSDFFSKSTNMSEQDQGLDLLAQSIARLNNIGVTIGTELEENNAMLDELSESTDNSIQQHQPRSQHGHRTVTARRKRSPTPDTTLPLPTGSPTAALNVPLSVRTALQEPDGESSLNSLDSEWGDDYGGVGSDAVNSDSVVINMGFGPADEPPSSNRRGRSESVYAGFGGDGDDSTADGTFSTTPGDAISTVRLVSSTKIDRNAATGPSYSSEPDLTGIDGGVAIIRSSSKAIQKCDTTELVSKFVDEDGFGLVLDEVGTPATKAIIVSKRDSLEEQVQRHEHNQRVAFDVALSIVNEISDTVFIFTALIGTNLFLPSIVVLGVNVVARLANGLNTAFGWSGSTGAKVISPKMYAVGLLVSLVEPITGSVIMERTLGPDSAIDTFLRRKIKLSQRTEKPLDNDTLRLSHDLGGLATYVSGNRLMGTSELLVGTLEDFPMLVINAMFVVQQQQRSDSDSDDGEGDVLTLAIITGIISLLHIVKTIWTFWTFKVIFAGKMDVLSLKSQLQKERGDAAMSRMIEDATRQAEEEEARFQKQLDEVNLLKKVN